MTLKDQVDVIKTQCGKLCYYGKGKCFTCKCEKAKRGMVVHHRYYIDNDVIYSNYPQNDTGRLQYYTDLIQLIKKNPKRFMYMCNTHHHVLTRFRRFGDKLFDKLCIARKLTKT